VFGGPCPAKKHRFFLVSGPGVAVRENKSNMMRLPWSHLFFVWLD
jgi:hypothetical protein